MTNDKVELTKSRREVLLALGSLSLLAALTGVIRGSLRFLTPPISQTRPMAVVAGRPADFPPGSFTPLNDSPVFMGCDEAGLFAVSAVCTHLGCTVAHRDDELLCPCHGSRFSLAGDNLAGPASRPLPHLAVTLNSDGLVEVHLTQPVEVETRLQGR